MPGELEIRIHWVWSSSFFTVHFPCGTIIELADELLNFISGYYSCIKRNFQIDRVGISRLPITSGVVSPASFALCRAPSHKILASTALVPADADSRTTSAIVCALARLVSTDSLGNIVFGNEMASVYEMAS